MTWFRKILCWLEVHDWAYGWLPKEMDTEAAWWGTPPADVGVRVCTRCHTEHRFSRVTMAITGEGWVREW